MHELPGQTQVRRPQHKAPVLRVSICCLSHGSEMLDSDWSILATERFVILPNEPQKLITRHLSGYSESLSANSCMFKVSLCCFFSCQV